MSFNTYAVIIAQTKAYEEVMKACRSYSHPGCEELRRPKVSDYEENGIPAKVMVFNWVNHFCESRVFDTVKEIISNKLEDGYGCKYVLFHEDDSTETGDNTDGEYYDGFRPGIIFPESIEYKKDPSEQFRNKWIVYTSDPESEGAEFYLYFGSRCNAEAELETAIDDFLEEEGLNKENADISIGVMGPYEFTKILKINDRNVMIGIADMYHLKALGKRFKMAV